MSAAVKSIPKRPAGGRMMAQATGVDGRAGDGPKHREAAVGALTTAGMVWPDFERQVNEAKDCLLMRDCEGAARLSLTALVSLGRRLEAEEFEDDKTGDQTGAGPSIDHPRLPAVVAALEMGGGSPADLETCESCIQVLIQSLVERHIAGITASVATNNAKGDGSDGDGDGEKVAEAGTRGAEASLSGTARDDIDASLDSNTSEGGTKDGRLKATQPLPLPALLLSQAYRGARRCSSHSLWIWLHVLLHPSWVSMEMEGRGARLAVTRDVLEPWLSRKQAGVSSGDDFEEGKEGDALYSELLAVYVERVLLPLAAAVQRNDVALPARGGSGVGGNNSIEGNKSSGDVSVVGNGSVDDSDTAGGDCMREVFSILTLARSRLPDVSHPRYAYLERHLDESEAAAKAAATAAAEAKDAAASQGDGARGVQGGGLAVGLAGMRQAITHISDEARGAWHAALKHRFGRAGVAAIAVLLVASVLNAVRKSAVARRFSVALRKFARLVFQMGLPPPQ